MTYMGVVTVPVHSAPHPPALAGHHRLYFPGGFGGASCRTEYRGYEIVSSAAFRVTRNSNLYLQEEESRNILESVRAELHNRRKGDAVRLEIEATADPEIIDRLRTNFELDPCSVLLMP